MPLFVFAPTASRSMSRVAKAVNIFRFLFWLWAFSTLDSSALLQVTCAIYIMEGPTIFGDISFYFAETLLPVRPFKKLLQQKWCKEFIEISLHRWKLKTNLRIKKNVVVHYSIVLVLLTRIPKLHLILFMGNVNSTIHGDNLDKDLSNLMTIFFLILKTITSPTNLGSWNKEPMIVCLTVNLSAALEATLWITLFECNFWMNLYEAPFGCATSNTCEFRKV